MELDGPDSIPSKVRVFVFVSMPRPTLGPIEPTIQLAQSLLHPGVKMWKSEYKHSSSCSTEVKSAWSFT
jgi:hypothetical protein